MVERKIIENIIGKGFADKMDEIFVEIGDIKLSRRYMVEELGCANFIAAVRLGKVLRRLNVTSPAKLMKLDPLSLARSRGIGEASLFVAMCILDSFNYDVTVWWGWKELYNVKFSTFKHHAMKRASRRKQEVA